MKDKIKYFLRSEEGEVAEWIITAAIIGIGSIPIILGIQDALLQTTGVKEDEIRSIIQSGY